MPFFLAPAEGFGISGLPVVAFTNIVFFIILMAIWVEVFFVTQVFLAEHAQKQP